MIPSCLCFAAGQKQKHTQQTTKYYEYSYERVSITPSRRTLLFTALPYDTSTEAAAAATLVSRERHALYRTFYYLRIITILELYYIPGGGNTHTHTHLPGLRELEEAEPAPAAADAPFAPPLLSKEVSS